MIEAIGWYGVIAILGAYALNMLQILPSDTLLYTVLNFTGALGIACNAYHKGNKQPLVLNTVWAIVAAIALLQGLF